MKNVIKLIIILFVVNGTAVNAQTNIGENANTCQDCKIPCLCSQFYANEIIDSTNRRLIKDNWNDFFGANLEKSFPIRAGVNVISVKFDGMGCIYPSSVSPEEYDKIKNDFLGDEVKYKKVYYRSFYNLYNQILKRKGTADEITFANSLKTSIDTSKIIKYNRTEYDYADFIKNWNEAFLPQKINEINDATKNNNIKKIIFFIHGYNVPYSLAQKQGNVLLDSILASDKTLKPENILFIRIFWPSGNFKKSEFDNSKECDYDNFEKWATASQFTYISNRAYFTAIALRRILTEMKTDLPLYLITHSHGSTVATSALLNASTKTKLQKGKVSDLIEKLMLKETLPNKKIFVFLNAPSIPGKNTFITIENKAPQNNYRFFVGYNEHDDVLLKRKFHIKSFYIKWITVSKHLSSTTLGCNRRHEIDSTQKIFEDIGLKNNFRSGVNSSKNQHDFFCYIQQIEFEQNLKKFLNGELFE